MSKSFNSHERYIAFMALGFGHNQSSALVFTRPIESERDTYRDLCAELLSALKPYMEKSNWCYDTFNGYINANSDLITKAESILGESQ